MADSATSNVILLTEHFTYRPTALIDDIVNSINVLAFKATEAVEKGLLGASPSDLGFKIPPPTTPESIAAAAATNEALRHEIENGVHQLETLLEARIDKNFDKLEIVALRSVLSIPPEARDWIRLSHYEGVNFAPADDAPDGESVKLLRRKLRETLKLHALLRAEKARNDATIRGLRALVARDQSVKREEFEEGETYPVFAFLQDKGELMADGKQPVKTTAEFTLSQVPALKSLLEGLEPRLEVLRDGSGAEGLVGEDQKSWRRERLEFVERETKRHMENIRGLELGEMGEVRDGEWQGEGRKLGKGEVEDLENIVGMVDSGDPGDPMDQDS